jgi:uncharacterized DUF497 family protein
MRANHLLSRIMSKLNARCVHESSAQARTGGMLSVSYLWTEVDPAVTKVRIFSARRSTQSEIRQYQENLWVNR